MYQPKTGAKCSCKRGIHRDNCPNCEGTGMVIDFRAIHARRELKDRLSLKLYEIKINWPIGDDIGSYRFSAKDEDQAWAKFCSQRFGALKPDRREWSIKEVQPVRFQCLLTAGQGSESDV